MSETGTPPHVETTEEAPTQRRIFAGWVILWILFAFLIANGLLGTFLKEEKKEKSYATEQLSLKQGVIVKRLAGMAGSSALGSTDDAFKAVKKETEKDAATSPAAARIYLAAQQEAGGKREPRFLATLLRSKDPSDRALSRLYASEKLSKGAAERLISEIDGTGFVFDLAKVQAREKAGIENSGREAIAPLWKAFAMAGAVLALLGIGLLSLVLWAVYLTMRQSGQIKPLGFPVGNITSADADRLALRAAQIVAAFLMLSIIGGSIGARTGNVIAASLIPSVGVLLFVLLISKLPAGDKRISLSDIGVNGQNFGRHLMWGFAGFIMEIPLMIAMALFGRWLFKFLPPPEHPASTLLQNNPNIAIILTVLFFGAMIAPFWEEIMFRGLMLPAVSKVTWGPLAGSLITSLIFAAIHPQGISTWLALGTVAAVSCALAYHTRSLVPSIVMHALHNGALLAGSLVIF